MFEGAIPPDCKPKRESPTKVVTPFLHDCEAWIATTAFQNSIKVHFYLYIVVGLDSIKQTRNSNHTNISTAITTIESYVAPLPSRLTAGPSSCFLGYCVPGSNYPHLRESRAAKPVNQQNSATTSALLPTVHLRAQLHQSLRHRHAISRLGPIQSMARPIRPDICHPQYFRRTGDHSHLCICNNPHGRHSLFNLPQAARCL